MSPLEPESPERAREKPEYGEFQEHPLVKALPPETDYMTYLTIVEYNLDKISLPLLERLLTDDERLATNIGWDLVQLLLPMLPDSKSCLDTVARLGNPREVVIKVNEILEDLGRRAASCEDDLDHAAIGVQGYEDGSTLQESSQTPNAEADIRLAPIKNQVCQLLAMVGTLHPRIRTKRPSRFLVTTIESVLIAYRGLGKDVLLGVVTDAILDLLQGLCVVIRPPLPPRAGSHAVTMLDGSPKSAVDPEAEAVDVGEASLQHKILVSFATQIFEALVVQSRQCFPADSITWTSRYVEIEFPGRLPWPKDFDHRPNTELLERLKRQERRTLDILASKLGVRPDKMRSLMPFGEPEGKIAMDNEELPISLPGSVMLLASTEFDRIEKDSGASQFGPSDHQAVVDILLSRPDNLDLGSRSLVAIDAVLILGWAWKSEDMNFLSKDTAGRLDGEISKAMQEAYNEYLQQLCVISSNAPSPVLRYQTHLLVTDIIHCTKEKQLRLGYIRDTLEFCPFENLRVVAIGWLKDELLTVFRQGRASHTVSESNDPFSQPETLLNLSEILFELPEIDLEDEDLEQHLNLKLPYWLAVLNLLYLLCTNNDIRQSLDVTDTVRKKMIAETFVRPLGALSAQMLGQKNESRNSGEGGFMLSDAALLDDAVARADSSLGRISADV